MWISSKSLRVRTKLDNTEATTMWPERKKEYVHPARESARAQERDSANWALALG